MLDELLTTNHHALVSTSGGNVVRAPFARPDKLTTRFGVGLDAELSDCLTLSASGETRFGGHQREALIGLGLRTAF